MTERPRAPIVLLPTGVPGLDEVLGGGLPEYSFNLIVGNPGSGKTTLAHQIMFGLASDTRPALYFTLLGEPPLKMLRYQQQMAFFDPARVGTSIRFISLSDVVLDQGLGAVLDAIIEEVERTSPRIVMVDSFQSIVRLASEAGLDLQSFVQRLAIRLTSWQATTFLVGEYSEADLQGNPVFTVADGILWLAQSTHRNSVVRKLQVVKSRGQPQMPGLHTFRISSTGIQVFPRISTPLELEGRSLPPARTASGIAGLDELMDGGIPAGDAVLVTGPSGTGKSIFAMQFIDEGLRYNEPGVIVVFEEHPREYLHRAAGLGFDLQAMVRQGQLKVLYLRPLDLSPDETLQEIREAVTQLGARRVVIDSVAGFELALAPSFREDFRESLYRLVGALTGVGITVLLTMEIAQTYSDLRLSPYMVSFLADDVILLRYVEIEGQLKKSLVVVKMRNSNHSKNLTLYDITDHGMVVRESLRDYRGIGTGAAELREGARRPLYPGLTERETVVLQALIELGAGSVAALGRRTGWSESDLTEALNRLVTLAFAVRREDEDHVLYQAVARPAGR